MRVDSKRGETDVGRGAQRGTRRTHASSTRSRRSASPPSTKRRAATASWRPYMRPIYPGARIAGTAVTVSVPPGDNWMIHVAVEQCQAGDVLVVAPTSACDCGYFGDLLATSLQGARCARPRHRSGRSRRRDAHGNEVFPCGRGYISAQGTVKATLGSVNIPLVCAGATRQPGRPRRRRRRRCLRRAARAGGRSCSTAPARASKRKPRVRARLAAGELGLDIYDMRDALAAKGLTYRDAKD